MQVARKDELMRTWFRSERIFLSEAKWYFQTREGVDVGPYDSEDEATIEAGMLRELLRDAMSADVAMGVIREFVVDSYAMGRPLTPQFSGARFTRPQPRSILAAARPHTS